jgi:hypothetical protein
MLKKTLVEQVKAARRVNTPVISIATADQWATAEAIYEALNGAPKWAWDALRGLHPVNDEGEKAMVALGDVREIASKTGNPRAMLDFIQQAPPKALIVMHNAHRFVDDPVVATGIGVLRDRFKADKRTLVTLAPAFNLPGELQQDVVALDEPMPNDEQLGAILKGLLEGAKGVKAPSEAQRTQVVAAARGLSAFLAEQTFAMSMTPEGLNIEECWERKRAAVNQTPGLKFCSNDCTFDDVRGLDQIAGFMKSVFSGANAPQAVLRIDEIDKHMAGSQGGDLSGVSADALGAVLRWMEDERHTGFLAIGPGGAGKSLVSKAIGGTFGVPTLEGDLGAAKGSLVGQSEERIRTLLKVASGVAGGGRILVVATCNRMAALPPELRRRFTFGTWYFDLPTDEGRKAIWKLYLDRYKIKSVNLPDDNDWTGAEIRNCCELAANLGITPEAAAAYIVPVAKSAPEAVRDLRENANGRFLNAASEGVYKMSPKATSAATKGRALTMEG